MKNFKRKFLIGSILIAVSAVGLGLLFGSSARREAAPEPIRRVVKLIRVSGETPESGVTYPGRVKPVRHAELFFRVSGPVIERNLKYGQTVEEGTVLMRIDPRDYQREVDRLTQEVEAQRIQSSLADTEYKRNKRLLETNAVSQAVFDSAEAKKQAADAQLRMLEVSLKIAQDKLKDTVLIAPFHGTVSDLCIEQYEIARANVPVVTLDDLREVEIQISIPAGNLPAVGLQEARQFLGRQFDVTFPGRGGKELKAAIYEFKPVASEESETYEVTLRMNVPEDFLILPGMSAEVHRLPHFRPANSTGIKVPFAAVIKHQGRDAVWKYHPETGKLELVPVKIGRIAGSAFVHLENGLAPGDLIVGAGGDWLTQETEVQPLNPEVLDETH